MKKLLILLILAAPCVAFLAFKVTDPGKKRAKQRQKTESRVQTGDELVDCLVKVKSKFGETCSQCGNSPDTYVVYVKNTCSKKLDVMIGVQESALWWRLATFHGVNSSDTLRVYACTGTGKWLRWAREAGDPSYSFPTQAEVNAQYK